MKRIEKLMVLFLLIAFEAVLFGQNMNSVAVSPSTTAFTLLVSGTATQKTTIVGGGLTIGTGGATGQTVQFFSCTSAPCTTGFTAVSEILSGTGYTSLVGSPYLVAPAGADLYIAGTAAAPYSVGITFYKNTN